jgi:hypothetical protein
MKSHPKTGEIAIKGTTYQLPGHYAGCRCTVTFDPVEPGQAALITPDGLRIPLKPLILHHPPPPPKEPSRGAGALQQLLDEWRGRQLPVAPAGFGLPEIFQSFAAHLGRSVPATEREAEALQAFYRQYGPFRPEAFENAINRVLAELGPDRPIDTYIQQLKRLIPPKPTEDQP